MGNFEKLSVLVIGVIIVMILVVAIHTWTSDPATPVAEGDTTRLSAIGQPPIDPGGARQPSSGMGTQDPLLVDPGGAVDPWDPDYEEDMTPSDEPTDRLAEEPRGEAAEDVEEPARQEPSVRETAQRTVTVKNGDTLGHISLRAYGTTRHWKKIAEANNVTARNIHPNMVLVIPEVAGAGGTSGGLEASSSGARPSCGCAYKVRRGDTIQSIAKAAYGDVERWPDIWFENMERISNPSDLESGVEISIPR